jgi:PKD repeat protein
MKRVLLALMALLAVNIASAQCTPSFTSGMAPQGNNLLRARLTNTTTPFTLPGKVTTFTIKWGDGGTSNAWTGNYYHNYSTPGTYYLKLIQKVYDSTTLVVSCIDSTLDSIVVAYTPCGTSFSWTQGTGGQVTFTANTPAGATGMSYSWVFVGAGTGTGSPITQTYTSNGTKMVILTAVKTGGCTYIDTQYVNVSSVTNCTGHTAAYTFSTAGLTAIFTNASPNFPAETKTAKWYFGDGNTSTSTSPSHAYAAAGNYNVCLVTTWYDSTTSSLKCKDSICKTVTVSTGGCSGATSNFTSSYTGWSASFTATSTNITGLTKKYDWYYGDGTFSLNNTSTNTTHNYTSGGNKLVSLITKWYNGSTLACMDSNSKTITLTALNYISGFITQDTNAVHIDSPDYKVWLIKFDTATNMLYAVDSLVANGTYWAYTPFQFNNKAAGVYRVKAKLLNGPTSGTGHVPTYHYSSLMWNTANTITHSGGPTSSIAILMKVGTITSGPGFVAGNVSAGANKGTANGIEGMTILLLDGAGNLVQGVVTDANGDYSFSNIPPANYNVYPEDCGYTTTSVGITIVGGNTSFTGVNFSRSISQQTITPATSGIITINNRNFEFGIYPNPAKDKVTIEWNKGTSENADIIITDVTGKKVFATTVSTGKSTELNLGTMDKGLYFITVSSGNAQNTQKLLLQ